MRSTWTSPTSAGRPDTQRSSCDARRDAQLGTKLREHVGDQIPLMYDGSAGFDLPDALYLGHAFSDAGFPWYEEPMR